MRRLSIPPWRFIAGLWLALAAGMLMGCAALNQVIQKPTVAFDGLDLTDASLLESTLAFRLKVHNPNPIGLRTGRISYNLQLNGSPFTKGSLDRGIGVPPKSEGILSLPVTVNYLDFLDSITALIREHMVAYDLNGTVAVGPVEIPFSAQGSFKLPRLPKISLAAIKIDRLSLSGAGLICRLQMDNTNAFNIPLKGLNYTLRLGNHRIASAEVDPGSGFGRKGLSSFDVKMDLAFADIGRAAYQLFKAKSGEYRIDGNMLMNSAAGGERRVPFDASGQVPFFH